MNALPDIQQHLTATVTNVFDTMVNLTTQVTPEPPADADMERVTGSVGIAGDQLTGAIYLHVPETLARRAAGSMLGLRGLAPADSPAISDVIGELTNMVAGGLKAALNDAGADCGMSTPAVIRGRHFAVEVSSDVTRSVIGFMCDQQSFSVEVHLKIN
jgi:chemotaxis protein CheX